MATLFHPDPTVTSCSFSGTVINEADDGSFDVPDAAVRVLCDSFGFTTETPPPVPSAAPPAVVVPVPADPAPVVVPDPPPSQKRSGRR